nr:LacI family DNA-binding transcriptional regulator [Rhodococcus sp. (in: high G+C Gram-positive bacteria)]
MDDVAARAGVSRTLVSFVMRGKPGAGEETRRRVLEIADEIGYKPDSAAQLLARGRSRTLGVLLDVHQPFQADLVTRIYPIAKAAGYEVLLSASAPGRSEIEAIESMLSHRCGGLILLGPSSDRDYLEELEERAVVVVVGKPMPPGAFDMVRSADASGIRQSVQHLVELGHRRIYHIGGGAAPGAEARSDAYRAAMRDRGLAEFARVIPGAHDEAAGIAAGRLMLDEADLPTAVMAGNDRCALGLMDSLDRAGVDVPRDVSVVGYDDSEIARLSRIDLTTVRQDIDGLATHAVEFAVARLEDDSASAVESIVEPQLIVRGSSGRPRSAQRDRSLHRRVTDL